MLPLHVFQHLYPNWISPDGLPSGLDHVSTRLTAYNGSHIPLYSALHGPIIWRTGGPGTQPHKVNSYWYIADIPRSCHPRSSIMQKASSCQDKFCHYSYPTMIQKLQALHLLPQQHQSSLLQHLQQPIKSDSLMP